VRQSPDSDEALEPAIDRCGRNNRSLVMTGQRLWGLST